jgi:hypothetical protein
MSAYTKVWIGEPLVEFSKNWNPRNYGTFGLSASQLKKIRDDLANLAKSTFAEVLSGGGYEVVTEATEAASRSPRTSSTSISPRRITQVRAVPKPMSWMPAR